MRSKEVLDELIALYKKTEAHRKIELLQRELAPQLSPLSIDLSVPSESGGSERGDKNIPTDEVIYEMHEGGMDYKEIEAHTGVKCPWFAIKRHARTL